MSSTNWNYLSMNGTRLMRVFLVLVGWNVFIFGCGDSPSSRGSDDFLSEKEMVLIMMDIYSVEARIASYGQSFDSSMKMFNLVEEDLLAKYGCTRQEYKNSLQFYYDNPDRLLRIYEAVVDSLSFRERKLTEESERKDE